MKLKFLLQKNAWFIEHECSWYCITGEEQLRIAASTLPLLVVDQNTLTAQPHLAGKAWLTSETAAPVPVRKSGFFRKHRGTQTEAASVAVRVALSEPDGTPVAERLVPIDESMLSSVEWMTRPFQDGWLDANVSLVLDNVRRLEIQAYLPALAESSGKPLIVHNDTAGTSSEIWLERAENNVVSLLDDGREGQVTLRLHCDPEPLESAGDSRHLGFVLTGESIEAA